MMRSLILLCAGELEFTPEELHRSGHTSAKSSLALRRYSRQVSVHLYISLLSS